MPRCADAWGGPVLKITEKIGFGVIQPVIRNDFSINFPADAAAYLSNSNKPPSTNFTLFGFIRPNTAGIQRRGLCRWGTQDADALTARLGYNASNNIAIGNSNQLSTVSSTGVIIVGQWCSIGISVGADLAPENVKFHHNGALLGSSAGHGGSPNVGTGPFVIGFGTDNTPLIYTNPFDGPIATWAIYGSVLSTTDVLALHNAGAGATLAGSNKPIASEPIRHWIMEEGTGTGTADEVSSPANDMAFNGGVSWSGVVPSNPGEPGYPN